MEEKLLTELYNIFQKMTDEELLVAYEEELEFLETGICSTQTLRPILDKYCELTSSGIILMEQELLAEIATRWYDKVKQNKEDYTSIRSGTDVWYVDFDESNVEHGIIKTVAFKNGKVDCFGVEWEDSSFDVYDGSGLGKYYFLSKDNADKRFIKGDIE